MASIRKRGNSYLLVVSMGYDPGGKRRAAQQKAVRPPDGLTPKQKEKWLSEQAMDFERECRSLPQTVNRNITLAEYTELWLRDVAPNKLAKSTFIRERQDTERFLPLLGQVKLADLRPEHFRKLYTNLRERKSKHTGKPLSEHTVEGVHACLCGILSDAMEGGFLTHNPAWRTYRYSGKKSETVIADEEIIVKEPKTSAGDRLVFFSAEMESLLREYRHFCEIEAEHEDERELTDEDYLFRRHGERLPMTPSTFTWRFKLILKKNGLPEKLTVHSLRHTAASLMIANGTDVTTVAGILGHAQPSTTLDIYSHSFDKNKRAASAALQESLDI